jgi:hypothetical protein
LIRSLVDQLFIAPAAAQAFMSKAAIGSLVGPPGGTFPLIGSTVNTMAQSYFGRGLLFSR